MAWKTTIVSTDADRTLVEQCTTRGRCAQACHRGNTVRKLVEAAYRKYKALARAGRTLDNAQAANANNFLNPHALGQNNAANQRRGMVTRVIEMILCVLSPSVYIDVAANRQANIAANGAVQLNGTTTLMFIICAVHHLFPYLCFDRCCFPCS